MTYLENKTIAGRLRIDRISLSSERIDVSRGFFEAFNVTQARDFVRKMMIENYITAILTHHPQKELLVPEEIRRKCERLVGTIFDRIYEIRNHPERLFELMKRLSRSMAPRDDIWFDEFDAAYRNYKHNTKLSKRDSFLSPFFKGTSLVDIGCGGGDLIAYLRDQHPELLRISGTDVVDWRTPGLDIDYHVVDFSVPGTTLPVKYDTALLMAVLHHVSSDEDAIKTFLNNVRTAVNLRLIVEEDVLLDREDLEHPKLDREDLEAKLQEQQLLRSYIEFGADVQRSITILGDVLANALSIGVPDMPFPFGFRTLTQWIRIFEESGFNIETVKVLGFQKGNFNQQCHILFILNPANRLPY